MYNSIISGTINNAVQERLTPFSRINIKTTPRLINKLINDETVPEITIIYFGKFNFLIKSPLFTIDPRPLLVASVKNDHKTIPNNIVTGKCGIPLSKRSM